MKNVIFIFTGVLVLSACTVTSRAVISQTVDALKASEDAKARLALQAPCAMTVGAKNRVLSEAEKSHVEALCGGPSDRPVSLKDLQILFAAPR